MNKTEQPPAQPSLSSVPPSTTTLEEWLDLPHGQSGAIIMECLDPTASAFHQDYWMQRTRRDGRLFSQVRPSRVVFGVVQKHSAGSSMVTQGTTKVLAATTFQIGQPSPNAPDRGDVVVQVNMSNGGGGGGGGGGSRGGSRGILDLKSFQQQKHADVLQALLQRMLEDDSSSGDGNNDDAKSIPACLNLLTGKACLRVVMTVMLLEDGGNVLDVCLLACMAAWKNTQLPVMGQNLKEVQGKLFWNHEKKKEEEEPPVKDIGMELVEDSVPLSNSANQRNYRISLTMGVWVHPTSGTTCFLLDPSSEEEACLDGNVLTVVTNLGTTGKLQIEYAGKFALSASDLALAAKLAQGRAEELSKVLLS